MKRKFDELNIDEGKKPPRKKRKLEDELKCPVSLCKFVYPVTLLCGHTFEHSSVKNQKKCPTCRSDIVIMPNVNYAFMNIIDIQFPGYKDRSKEKIKKDVSLNENFGLWAMEQIEINKLKVFYEYLGTIREDFLDDSIKRGRRTGVTRKVSVFIKAELEGHLEEFKMFLANNNFIISISHMLFGSRSNRICKVEWDILQS